MIPRAGASAQTQRRAVGLESNRTLAAVLSIGERLEQGYGDARLVGHLAETPEARRTLADRLIRSAYANDRRLHDATRSLAEAERALADGGEELDMVVNISKVLSGDWDYVRHDIKTVVEAAHAAGQRVKVIFENCYLQDKHKVQAS